MVDTYTYTWTCNPKYLHIFMEGIKVKNQEPEVYHIPLFFTPMESDLVVA